MTLQGCRSHWRNSVIHWVAEELTALEAGVRLQDILEAVLGGGKDRAAQSQLLARCAMGRRCSRGRRPGLSGVLVGKVLVGSVGMERIVRNKSRGGSNSTVKIRTS